MIPVGHSNQLSYEATDVGSWSFVGSNVPVMNESTNEMIYEMDHILNSHMKSSKASLCNYKNGIYNCEDHSFT